MKKVLTLSIMSLFALTACKNETKPVKESAPVEEKQEELAPIFKNEAHELVYDMVQKVGDYSSLMRKKDVVYTYTYQTPDGKKDVSTEKYVFNGELSYGKYTTHERTLADLEGVIEQGYDGSEYWVKHNGELINDEAAIKRAAFNRPTNFYWFAMMPKLLDPGLNYEYVNTQTINDKEYYVVKVTFNGPADQAKDIYQVYINKTTKLVDQFLFTVMDFGKSDPLLMVVEYETVDGLLLPTKRKYKASNWDAEVTDEPWINVNWTDISFNNGLEKSVFEK